MPDTFFAARHRAALQPARWRFISSWFAPDTPAQDEPPPLREWTRCHEDRHAHVEVLVVLAGHGWYGLRQQRFRVEPGTVMLFDAYEPHQRGYPACRDDQEHLWLTVMPSHFTARLLRLRRGQAEYRTARTLVVSQAQAGVCLERWAFAYAGVEGVAPAARRLRLAATVSGMLAALDLAAGQPRGPAGRRGVQEQVMASIRKHILETAGNGATLEHLARIAGYSRFHFHRLFRELSGETVQACIDAARLTRVQERLAQGVQKKRIAAELGFSCPAAFSRWLRGQNLCHRPDDVARRTRHAAPEREPGRGAEPLRRARPRRPNEGAGMSG